MERPQMVLQVNFYDTEKVEEILKEIFVFEVDENRKIIVRKLTANDIPISSQILENQAFKTVVRSCSCDQRRKFELTSKEESSSKKIKCRCESSSLQYQASVIQRGGQTPLSRTSGTHLFDKTQTDSTPPTGKKPTARRPLIAELELAKKEESKTEKTFGSRSSLPTTVSKADITPTAQSEKAVKPRLHKTWPPSVTDDLEVGKKEESKTTKTSGPRSNVRTTLSKSDLTPTAQPEKVVTPRLHKTEPGYANQEADKTSSSEGVRKPILKTGPTPQTSKKDVTKTVTLKKTEHSLEDIQSSTSRKQATKLDRSPKAGGSEKSMVPDVYQASELAEPLPSEPILQEQIAGQAESIEEPNCPCCIYGQPGEGHSEYMEIEEQALPQRSVSQEDICSCGHCCLERQTHPSYEEVPHTQIKKQNVTFADLSSPTKPQPRQMGKPLQTSTPKKIKQTSSALPLRDEDEDNRVIDEEEYNISSIMLGEGTLQDQNTGAFPISEEDKEQLPAPTGVRQLLTRTIPQEPSEEEDDTLHRLILEVYNIHKRFVELDKTHHISMRHANEEIEKSRQALQEMEDHTMEVLRKHAEEIHSRRLERRGAETYIRNETLKQLETSRTNNASLASVQEQRSNTGAGFVTTDKRNPKRRSNCAQRSTEFSRDNGKELEMQACRLSNVSRKENKQQLPINFMSTTNNSFFTSGIIMNIYNYITTSISFIFRRTIN